MAIHLDQPVARTSAASWWRVITIFLVADIFIQSAFAGAMLSGVEWAHRAHMANALLAVGAAFLASAAAIVMLRRVRNGRKLGFLLLGLAVTALVELMLGKMTARGENLLWAHVPLGVILVGLAGQAVASARELGEDAGGT